jgi:hypothetical protein
VNILSGACAVQSGLPALAALHFQWQIPGIFAILGVLSIAWFPAL